MEILMFTCAWREREEQWNLCWYLYTRFLLNSRVAFFLCCHSMHKSGEERKTRERKSELELNLRSFVSSRSKGFCVLACCWRGREESRIHSSKKRDFHSISVIWPMNRKWKLLLRGLHFHVILFYFLLPIQSYISFSSEKGQLNNFISSFQISFMRSWKRVNLLSRENFPLPASWVKSSCKYVLAVTLEDVLLSCNFVVFSLVLRGSIAAGQASSADAALALTLHFMVHLFFSIMNKKKVYPI